MHIAFVKKRFSLRCGGSERYTVTLSRQFQKLGHQVSVIGEHIDEDLTDEVEFIPVKTNRLTSAAHNHSFAVRAGHIADQRNFDIVYGIGRAYGLDAVRVTERLQSHWLGVRYRNGISRALQRINPRHRTLIELERVIYNSDSVRRVVTQSHLDRELVQKYYNVPEHKLRTIYNGVDTELFHPGVKSERNVVRDELGISADAQLLVFASMDFEGKGLRSILRAIAYSKHRETELLVLGTGPVRKFQRIAEQLGIARRIHFAGRRSDIQRCYGAGDLFILPTAYEPFPNVNLEAMACGLPVMTSTTSGGADIVTPGETGWLVPTVHSVDEMIDGINLHFDLTGRELEAMSARCVQTAQQMPIENNIRQTLQLFEEVLDEKRAA
ncbi:glycosyltransferase family 4 protein [Thalassoroseus pseudoceratinae]|uniref:glycosyltransferase family 4 protein n=1 Tax=Thalassoroseus pseudoceratinae TaxID=2713176 RepID=UPI00141FB5F0|nr:glycosyltransferase family 4 protein [Thalassoroseus pseudoceratinae]